MRMSAEHIVIQLDLLIKTSNERDVRILDLKLQGHTQKSIASQLHASKDHPVKVAESLRRIEQQLNMPLKHIGRLHGVSPGFLEYQRIYWHEFLKTQRESMPIVIWDKERLDSTK